MQSFLGLNLFILLTFAMGLVVAPTSEPWALFGYPPTIVQACSWGMLMGFFLMAAVVYPMRARQLYKDYGRSALFIAAPMAALGTIGIIILGVAGLAGISFVPSGDEAIEGAFLLGAAGSAVLTALVFWQDFLK